MDRTIGQEKISSWFPGFLIVKKFSFQAGILGQYLPACEHRLPTCRYGIKKAIKDKACRTE